MGSVATVAFAPDSKSVATGSDGVTLRLWDLGAEKPRAMLQGNPGGGYGIVHAAAFAPSGVVAWGTSLGTVKINDSSDGKDLFVLRQHTGNVFCVAFSRDGSLLASGGSDGAARLWNPTTGDAVAAFGDHTGAVYAVAFSPDGATLAGAGADLSGAGPGVLRLWTVPPPQK
jgi:WD40 repeat protein